MVINEGESVVSRQGFSSGFEAMLRDAENPFSIPAAFGLLIRALSNEFGEVPRRQARVFLGRAFNNDFGDEARALAVELLSEACKEAQGELKGFDFKAVRYEVRECIGKCLNGEHGDFAKMVAQGMLSNVIAGCYGEEAKESGFELLARGLHNSFGETARAESIHLALSTAARSEHPLHRRASDHLTLLANSVLTRDCFFEQFDSFVSAKPFEKKSARDWVGSVIPRLNGSARSKAISRASDSVIRPIISSSNFLDKLKTASKHEVEEAFCFIFNALGSDDAALVNRASDLLKDVMRGSFGSHSQSSANAFFARVLDKEFGEAVSGRLSELLEKTRAGTFGGEARTFATNFKDWLALAVEARRRVRELSSFAAVQPAALPRTAAPAAR